ncbi:hypothetical protein AB0I81_18555 [Nonomuraea sp. NPDC050404]|uniref:hypothetical protein n=1 Tax=Nonomuraea sp. NPDC050404 TaxID=3155783 RepID=UPI003404086C
MKMFRSAEGLPEHNCGALGRVAHGALTAPLESPGEASTPRLFLGYNTLPDPPFPMTGLIEYEMAPGAADLDLPSVLRLLAQSLKSQPVPPVGTYDETHRRTAATMRADAMVIVFSGRAFSPEQSPPARALWENLVEGYYREGDAEACAGARQASVGLGVDREDGRVLLMAERSPSGEHARPARVGNDPEGTLFDLLAEVLDAQYRWTRAAFGL